MAASARATEEGDPLGLDHSDFKTTQIYIDLAGKTLNHTWIRGPAAPMRPRTQSTASARLRPVQKTVKRVGRAVVPSAYHRQVRTIVSKTGNFGLRRYCPCCRAHVRRFRPFGLVPRPEALCPACGSLERHRLIHLYLRRRTDLFDGRHKKMLHVAPEEQLSRLFAGTSGIDYLSADLFSTDAMIRMDVMDIQYPDETFDVIYCSHVLEHVSDDRKAMREFHRVLRTGGWAILQVPISDAEVTFEDSTITSPEERERAFGQFDHVRRYGADYKDRLEEAGFSVEIDGFVRELDDRTVTRYGLMRSEDVYRCTRVS